MLSRIFSTLVCMLLLAAPFWAQAAEAAPGPGPGVAALMKLIFGLLAVIASIFVLAKVLPRMGAMRLLGNKEFRVLASLAVGSKERIVLLQAGEQQILVGVTPASINPIHVVQGQIKLEELASAQAQPNWLAKALGGR